LIIIIIIIILANEGIQREVGGRGMRGGLLVVDPKAITIGTLFIDCERKSFANCK
jgi:hypothetical protein